MKIFLLSLALLFTSNAIAVRPLKIVVDSHFLELAIHDLFKDSVTVENVSSSVKSCHESINLKPSEVREIKKSDYYFSLNDAFSNLENHHNVNTCKDIKHPWLNMSCTAFIYKKIVSITSPALTEKQKEDAQSIIAQIAQLKDVITVNFPNSGKKIYTTHHFEYDLARDKIIKISGHIFNQANQVKPSVLKMLKNQPIIILSEKNKPMKLTLNKHTKVVEIDVEFHNAKQDENCSYCRYIVNLYKVIKKSL